MKSSILPISCGLALAVMSAAAVSHHLAVSQFVTAFHQGLPAATSPATPAAPHATPELPSPSSNTPILAAADAKPATATEPHQEEFYTALLSRLESLQNQNRDLQDQLAETNRDLMKLEFRVDTHSESFRPLPVNELPMDTGFDEDLGVLPPRADPVFPISFE
jgi:hypothetical protein